ncbi:hypothetical protein [Rhizobium aegyptiacum]|nr:hypothetical protein [Rhizobium aegyptiacum]
MDKYEAPSVAMGNIVFAEVLHYSSIAIQWLHFGPFWRVAPW